MDRSPVQFRCGRDQQVGEGQGAVEACLESMALDLESAGEDVVVGAEVVEGVEPRADPR
nr:hypothetical protein [Streptomyces scabiei]